MGGLAYALRAACVSRALVLALVLLGGSAADDYDRSAQIVFAQCRAAPAIVRALEG